jgi:hypothetical protein
MESKPRSESEANPPGPTCKVPPTAKPDADGAQVLKLVQAFCDAMAADNPEACRALFAPASQFTAVRPSPQGFTIQRRSMEEFSPPPGKVLERLWHPTVLVAGRLAVVWAPYDFHVNGRFTHNGTDVFTLMKCDSDWRIINLAYTVEPAPPTRHPAGPP